MQAQKVSVNISLQGKNLFIAYLLWWFLGWAGVHRYYLGRIKTGIAQLLLLIIGSIMAFFVIGYALVFAWFIWWALDAYFTYKMVQEENVKLGVVNSTFSFSKSGSLSNELDELEKLHALYEKGALTKEQYEERKSALL
ncbi:hypothetical protein MNBD_GAMMA07-281 [hydrothermal vent metagenome]|uniref:TM2 domain-containing protein n=1 Tax=hydrothermal vent metagenome TaxID=652676 RepID=A0A3B0X4A3_9ZZZZ